MSEKKKLLLVGAGLAATVIAAIGLFVFSKTDRSSLPENNEKSAFSSPSEESVVTRKGKIVSVSVEGKEITVESEEGAFSFSISKTEITDVSGETVQPEKIALGSEVEAMVLKGEALFLKIISIPDIAVISPKEGNIVDLEFKVEGVALKKGQICFSLKNRRTGSLYAENISSAVDSSGKFSFSMDLSSALDALPGDSLDGEMGICGEDPDVSVSWGYFGGLTSKIKVYFFKGSCSNLQYAERVVSASRSAVKASLEEMIKGPSVKEAAEGYFTAAPKKAGIRSIDIKSGVVHIDFYKSILDAPRCGASALKSQMLRTIGQFPLDEFVLTIEGEEDNPLN